jgi:hypothetical protein
VADERHESESSTCFKNSILAIGVTIISAFIIGIFSIAIGVGVYSYREFNLLRDDVLEHHTFSKIFVEQQERTNKELTQRIEDLEHKDRVRPLKWKYQNT